VQAYKRAEYQDAIAHFERSAAADPANPVPHLCLAQAYAKQYRPSSETAENKQLAQRALDEFEKVLALHPSVDQQKASLKGEASLYFKMKQFADAKESFRKLTIVDPDDAESYYSIAIIDWVESYAARMKKHSELKLTPDARLTGEPCWEIRATNEERVKDGIAMLTKAIDLRPDYDDAMAYMNLMYRERADIQCGDAQAHDADMKTADKWVDLIMASKKAKSEAAPELKRHPSER